MTDEFVTIQDDEQREIGLASKELAHRLGLWHKVFHCWVLCLVDSQPAIVLQRRSPQARVQPNMLDASAAGHYTAGESNFQAVRELNEELGLYPDFSELIKLGVRPEVSMEKDMLIREFCHTYVYNWQGDAVGLRVQEEELASLVVVSLVDFEKLTAGGVSKVPSVEHLNGGSSNATFTTANDLVTLRSTAYYHQIALACQQVAIFGACSPIF